MAILGTGLALNGFRPRLPAACRTNDPKFFKGLTKQDIDQLCGRRSPRPPKRPRIPRLADKFAPLKELLNEKP
ncbi:unnamed protein product [Heligmosomoides polygyrus]|uniref:Uncharacterized protein n=1 Tax=Heligmosomoides polygyrus TaxID=6339 RepID=A0A183FQ04_HELPZ|nr:unnamed protein product [Heligmosomoides polygyrus]